MRYLYPLAFVLLLVSCQEEKKETTVVTDRSKTDWAFYKLEGNVKTVSEKSYEDNSGQKGKMKHEIASEHDTDLTFNNKGMLILEKKWMDGTTPYEETKYDGREKMLGKDQYINGQIGIKTQHSIDKKGNVTGIIRRNPDNSQLDRIAMTYNGKYVTEKKSFSSQDNPNDRITYEYDKKGNLKSESMYFNTEYVQIRNIYEYDSQNRKISETRHSKDKLLYTTTYGYEGKNLVRKETTGPGGAIEYRERNKYDEKGNLTERSVVDSSDKSMTVDSYQRDSNGNITNWTVTRNGAPEMQAVYQFDNHNNVVSAKVGDSKGKMIDSRTYTYDYDTQGNWIKKTITLNGQPLVIVERKITYFDGEEDE